MADTNSTPTKACTKCGEAKPATSEFFHRNKNTPSGFTQACKLCSSARKVADYAADPEKFKSRAQAHRAKNPEAHRAQCKVWVEANKEKLAEYRASHYKANKVAKQAVCKAYHIKHRQRLNIAARERYAADPQTAFDRNTRYKKERVKNDPVFALLVRATASINNHLRKGGYSKRTRSHEILGCDWESFKAHIERQFLHGMSWDNRGEWELDHIVPMATAKTEADVIALNHHTNLRPLWREMNRKKSDTVTHLI